MMAQKGAFARDMDFEGSGKDYLIIGTQGYFEEEIKE